MQKNGRALYNSETDNQSEAFKKLVIEETELVKPIIKEQLFKEYILGAADSEELFKLYCKTFDVDERQDVRMFLIHPTNGCKYEDLFFLRNIAEQCIGDEHIIICTTLNDNIFVITDILDSSSLLVLMDKVRRVINNCYKIDVIILYSDATALAEAPIIHERLVDCINYSFYASDTRILYEKDIKSDSGSIVLKPQYSKIEDEIKNGRVENAMKLIDNFFEELESAAPLPDLAKTYCLELYVCMIRCCAIERIDQYMNGIVTIQEKKYLSEIKEYINDKAGEIASANVPRKMNMYSSLIRETLDIIDSNIANENLSLRWLSGTILYTNVDYLGKLFKKETGKNFSHYVMEKRMELAKNIILEGEKDRIYEIAESVGYGSNPQYFSQVFKKYTGFSPLEYKGYSREKKANGM